jgi:hypothetical protein
MPVVWPVTQPQPAPQSSGRTLIPPPPGPSGATIAYVGAGYTGTASAGIFFVLTQTFQGAGHTGSLGQGTFAAPGGLATHRALGEGLIVTEKWVPRLTGIIHARGLGTPTTLGRSIQLAGLQHARGQGSPAVISRIYPPGLQHTRAIVAPEITHAILQLAALDRV